MQRLTWWCLASLIVLVACEGHLVTTALPALVATRPPAPAAVVPLLLVPQEKLIWDVQAHGLTIGRAELVVGDHEVHSRFGTTGVVRSVASVHHDLTTQLDPARAFPTGATELVQHDGTNRQIVSMFEGNSYVTGDPPARHYLPDASVPLHSLHTALGWLRTWAKPDVRAAYIYVLEAGRLYRFDAAQPVAEDLLETKTLRIEGRVTAVEGDDEPIAVTIWLSADPARVPQRLVINFASWHITAELVANQ
jgi:hypothetical protein